jgi:hypothetical protein
MTFRRISSSPFLEKAACPLLLSVWFHLSAVRAGVLKPGMCTSRGVVSGHLLPVHMDGGLRSPFLNPLQWS